MRYMDSGTRQRKLDGKQREAQTIETEEEEEGGGGTFRLNTKVMTSHADGV